MAKADKIYEIAEKLGYEGETSGTVVDAIYAVADALGFDGAHDARITLALEDLYTVAEGGGGGVGAGVTIGVKKTGVPGYLGFEVADANYAYLYVTVGAGSVPVVPAGIEYLLAYPNDGATDYDFSDGNVSATVETNGTETPFADFVVVDVGDEGDTHKVVKFTPPAPSEGDQVYYTFTITA